MIPLVSILSVLSPVDADEIVVTGDRAAATSIEAERSSDVDTEIIGQEFLSRQVSSEIADVVARLPGVALLTENGDIRFVQIRGVRPELGGVTLDGLPVGTPDPQANGRQFPLDLFSTRLFSGIEVLKVPLPSHEGQGIGGILNLTSLDPFALSRTRLSARAGTGDDGESVEVTGLAGLDFGKRFSLALGVSYAQQEREFGVREFRQWREFAGVTFPRSLRTARVADDTQRLNGVLSIGFTPHDRHEFAVRVLGGRLEDMRGRDRYEDRVGSAMGTDASGMASASLGILGDISDNDRSLVLGSFSGFHTFGTGTDVEWTVSTSRGEFRDDYLRWVFVSDPAEAVNAYTVDSDGFATISGAGEGLLDDLQFDLRTEEDLTLVDDSHIVDFKISHDLSPRISFSYGARWNDRQRRNDAQNNSQSQAQPFSYTSVFDPVLIDQETAKGSYPVYDLPLNDLEAYGTQNGAIYAPRVQRDQINSILSDYDISETVTAGFVSGRYDTESLTFLAGVRAEHTSFDASGIFLSLAGAEPRQTETSRTDWLPMAALTWRPAEKWQVRLAAAKRLGRPGLDVAAPNAGLLQDGSFAELSIGNPDLKTRTSDNYDLSVEYYPADDFVIGASLFRKDIENDILQAVEVFTGTAAGERLEEFGLTPLSPLTYLAVSQARNVQDYGLDGMEIFLSGNLGVLHDGLSDFSATTSYTAVDERGTYNRGEATEPLRAPEQTPQQAAVTVAYTGARLGITTSFRWGDEYISGLGDTVLDDTRQRAVGKLDAQITYDITENVVVRLEASNITDEYLQEYEGINPDYPAMIMPQSRAIFLGTEIRL